MYFGGGLDPCSQTVGSLLRTHRQTNTHGKMINLKHFFVFNPSYKIFDFLCKTIWRLSPNSFAQEITLCPKVLYYRPLGVRPTLYVFNIKFSFVLSQSRESLL